MLEFPGVREEQQINETSRELPRESSSSASFFTASSTPIDRLVYKPTKQTRKPSSPLHTEGSRQAFPQKNASTDPTSKITLNSYPYFGSFDSTRSPPDESWSRGSSPRLEQAHPHIYPDERRSSVVSFDSTVAPSSPQPTSPKSKKRERRPQATQADTVLLKFLAPDQPLVAIRAGESPLSWSTGSEGNNEVDMEGGAQDSDSGGGSSSGGKGNNRNESREQSTDQPNGGTGEASGEGSANNGESGGAYGNGGGDERKGNSGGGMGGKGGRDNDKGDDEDSKGLGKGKDSEKKNKDEGGDEDKEKAQSTGNDNMDIDTVTADALKSHDIPKPEKGAPPPEYEGGPVEVEPSSSETAVSLMALAAGDDRQPFTSATSLPGIPSKAGGTAWAPNARAKSPNPSQSRGLPPSPGPSTQLFQNNKLPLLNSPTQLPSMVSSMNSQPASSPNSLPPGNDGRHTTLPPVSSIQVLAEMAEKALPTQGSTSWTNNRMPPNTRTVYPTVSSHVSVAPSNRTAQAPRSPGLPAPPGQSPHGGFGPDSNSRPPVHHMTVQQKQYYLNQDPPSPYYSSPHQHYQPPYPPMKEGASSNTNGSTVSYQSSIIHPRELPGIMQNHSPPSSGFFSPPALSGRRDSTTMEYYPAGNTPPSGPSTGDTMPSSGTEDTITSPRSRSTVAPGAQGPLASGGFKCEFTGCKAPPFQTQYLLK